MVKCFKKCLGRSSEALEFQDAHSMKLETKTTSQPSAELIHAAIT